MKKIFLMCAASALVPAALCFAPLVPLAAAIQDDDLIEPSLSADTVKSDYGAEDEEAQIQESDEDLAGFAGDYIKKDTALKGAFFIEDRAGKKILKLTLEAVLEKIADGADNAKIAEAVFKDAAGKKHRVLFHLQSAGFSGVDIFKIELKKEENPKPAKKEEQPKTAPKK
ncbi:MAG: hypothetical protein KKH28_14405 [Elusimicrobia bacterium]|nr:hypothetical protein [Elusimicrobiota bacterium]